ncbi:MAG: DUF2851 family protein [Prevotella sp.]|nr:DUF2851 family protein [Prevotella sp.]
MCKTINLNLVSENDVNLLQYCWKHRLTADENRQTMDSREVQVIDPGLHNQNSGAPDFFNAKVKIDGTLWVGNVVVTDKASDWYVKGMDKKKGYDNVVLVVTGTADTEIVTSQGQRVEVMQMEVPQGVVERYKVLTGDEGQTLCHRYASENCSSLTIRAWQSALQTERMEWQMSEVERRVRECGSWDAAYFVTVARTFGMGVNGDLMERWAKSVSLQILDNHADDLFQLEAVFLGQAGLLDLEIIPEKFQHDAMMEGYFAKLRNEYLYLSHKYSLLPVDGRLWKPMGSGRMASLPVALSWLANIFYQRKTSLQTMLGCKSVKEIHDLLRVSATPYWQMHNQFGQIIKKSERELTDERLNLIVINAIVPTLFAYGRAKQREDYCDRAFDFIEQCKTEKNDITKYWEQLGVKSTTAGDSQALIQLQREYCNKHQCLRCRFGYEFLKK